MNSYVMLQFLSIPLSFHKVGLPVTLKAQKVHALCRQIPCLFFTGTGILFDISFSFSGLFKVKQQPVLSIAMYGWPHCQDLAW